MSLIIIMFYYLSYLVYFWVLGYCHGYSFIQEGVCCYSVCHFEFQWLRRRMMAGEVILKVGNQGLGPSVVGHRLIGQVLKWVVSKK